MLCVTIRYYWSDEARFHLLDVSRHPFHYLFKLFHNDVQPFNTIRYNYFRLSTEEVVISGNSSTAKFADCPCPIIRMNSNAHIPTNNFFIIDPPSFLYHCLSNCIYWLRQSSKRPIYIGSVCMPPQQS